jgi:hypothetical protein
MFNRLERLHRTESGEPPSVLDSQEIAARFEELRALKDGCLDGDGIAPVKHGLEWLAGIIERDYPNHLPLPYIYPVRDGGVQLELPIKEQEASLEIDLVGKTGEWHVLDLSTNREESRELDLQHPEGWTYVIDRLEKMRGKAERLRYYADTLGGLYKP